MIGYKELLASFQLNLKVKLVRSLQLHSPHIFGFFLGIRLRRRQTLRFPATITNPIQLIELLLLN